MGLPQQGPTVIRQAVNRQLRLIARSPAHIWHTTTEEMCRLRTRGAFYADSTLLWRLGQLCCTRLWEFSTG